jgi:tripartite-type tricarboxylate transporter receptor subunit TctC
VTRLNAEFAAVVNEPEVRERLLAQGAEPVSGPPELLRNQLTREMEVWGKLIREAGLKVE